MNDRHAELKKQYEIDANHHPRPWELWECRAKGWPWVKNLHFWPNSGPMWDNDLDYRRKPDAPVWPTEPEKKGHMHGWVLQELSHGVDFRDFEVRQLRWPNEEWRPMSDELGGGLDMRWLVNPSEWQVRRKPPKVVMHQIVEGGPQFPAPLVEAPPVGVAVYWPSVDGYYEILSKEWCVDDHSLADRLKNGVLHLSKKAAECQGKAIAHAARGTPA